MRGLELGSIESLLRFSAQAPAPGLRDFTNLRRPAEHSPRHLSPKRSTMRKQTMSGQCGLWTVLSALTLFLFTSAQAADLVSLKQGLLSVNLKDTALLEVAKDIEKQSGVWFRGDETLFQEKISVTFNNLPLEDGLKRILANLNYSILFDARNKITGVMVMGEGEPAATPPYRPGTIRPRVTTPLRTPIRPTPPARNRPWTSGRPAGTVRQPARVAPQPSGPVEEEPEPPPEPSHVQGSALTPGETDASDGPLPPDFRNAEKAPSPASPVIDKETPQPLKDIKRAQPPAKTP